MRPGLQANVPSNRPSLVWTAQVMGRSQGLTDVHGSHSISGQPGGRGETCEGCSLLSTGGGTPASLHPGRKQDSCSFLCPKDVILSNTTNDTKNIQNKGSMNKQFIIKQRNKRA